MTGRRKWWLGLAVAAGVSEGAWAQMPALPGAGAAPAGAAAPVGGNGLVPGAPGYGDVAPPVPGGMFGNVINGCEYLKFKTKQCLCNSVLGQMLNGMLTPMSTFSGGLVPPLCPPNAVNPADLAKPSDSAEGAAARIKADEADAKARAASVRYLGTVDCHYWPEAQDALINALRADRNECVRLAAAEALAHGCCCTPKTIIALSITVAGTDEDGMPSETSERVRSVAYVALSQCAERFPPPPAGKEPPKEPKPKPEPIPGPPVKPPVNGQGSDTKPGEKTRFVTAAYYQRAAATPMPQAVSKAREALKANSVTSTPGVAPTPGAAKQGLFGIAYNAIVTTPPAPATPPATESVHGSAERVIEVVPPGRSGVAPAPLAPLPAAPIPTRIPGPQALAPNQPMLLYPATPARPLPAPTASLSGRMEVTQKRTLPAPPTLVTPLPVIAPPPVAIVPSAPPMSPYVPHSFNQAPASPTVVPAAAVIVSAPSPKPTLAPAVSPGGYGNTQERWRRSTSPAPIVVESTPLPPLPPPPAPKPQPASSGVMTAGFYGTPVVERPRPPAPPVVASRETEEQTGRWVAMLREAPDPEARDWAASRLQEANWRAHPEVVHTLLIGATRDAAPSVRTACIRTLQHMDASTTQVLSALNTLAGDRDPAVKQAAKEALQEMLAKRR